MVAGDGEALRNPGRPPALGRTEDCSPGSRGRGSRPLKRSSRRRGPGESLRRLPGGVLGALLFQCEADEAFVLS